MVMRSYIYKRLWRINNCNTMRETSQNPDVYILNSLVKTALQLIICFRFLLRLLPLKDPSPSLLVILCLRACMLRDEMHYKCSTRGKDDYNPDLTSHLVTTVLPASVCGGKHLIKC